MPMAAAVILGRGCGWKRGGIGAQLTHYSRGFHVSQSLPADAIAAQIADKCSVDGF